MEETESNKALRKDEWKKKMKSLKDEKKKQNQLKKEEASLKKLMGPKDSKVVIIDRTMLEKLSGGTQQSVLNNKASLKIEEFPTLSSSPKPRTVTPVRLINACKSWSQMVETPSGRSTDPFPALERSFKRKQKITSLEVNAKESIALHYSDAHDSSKKEGDQGPTKPKPAMSNIQGPGRGLKKVKRKDPIMLDLSVCLKVKDKKNDQKQKKAVRGSKYKKHTERNVLGGNMLDASNPQRSKGKQREHKKKKLTFLKKMIIKERIAKAKLLASMLAVPVQKDLKEQSETAKDLTLSTENTVESDRKVKNTAGPLKDTIECDIEEKNATEFEKRIEASVDNVDEKKEIQFYFEKLNLRRAEIKRVKIENKGLEQKNKDLIMKETTTKEKTNEPCEKHVLTRTETVKTLFSSRFREYCENALTPSLNSAVKELLKELVHLQDRMHARDPIKAQARRRLVSGFREAHKFLKLKKVKLLIVAPDLENLKSEGSINSQVAELKAAAASLSCPCVFALDRRKLGYTTLKKVPVSVVAVLSYDGLEVQYERVLEELKVAQDIINPPQRTPSSEDDSPVTDEVTSQVISSLLSVLKDTSVTEHNPLMQARDEEIESN